MDKKDTQPAEAPPVPVDREGADIGRAINSYCDGFNAGFEEAYRQFIKGALIGLVIFGLARLLAYRMNA